VYGIIADSRLPNNNEIWLHTDAYKNATSAIQGSDIGRIANFLPSTANAAVSADTSAWDTGATAHATSHAYAIDDIIAVSTNSGRLFICTTPGTSAGTIPDYTTTTDGQSITDGTAIFTAMVRFALTTTITSPQLAGTVYGLIRLGRPLTLVYIDPTLTVA
jgi:hypothetical protein